MAGSAPQQPEWSGLQVNEAEMQDPAPQVAEEEAQKIPRDSETIDYFARDKILQNPDDGDNQKYAVTPGVDQHAANDAGQALLVEGIAQSPSFSEEKQATGEPKRAGLLPKSKKSRQRLWILLGAILLIVAIAIAVPCGVLLSRNSDTGDSASDSDSNSNTTEPVINTNGTVPDTEPDKALNGTRIAAFQPPAAPGELWLFWQTASADIRMSRRHTDGSWSNGTSMNISNALNGTAMAVAAHSWTDEGSSESVINHLVFETVDGYYADLINYAADATDIESEITWSDGGLYGLERRTPSTGPHINMVWSQCGNGTGFIYLGGANAGWWNEWAYDAPTASWQHGRYLFNSETAYGGGTAQQVGSDSIMYLLSPRMQLKAWYRDLDDPELKWYKMADQVDGVWPNTSVAGTHASGDPKTVYYQDGGGVVNVAVANGTDKYSVWAEHFTTNLQPIGGANLHVEALKSDNGSVVNHFFFQEANATDGIVHYSSPNTTTWDFVEAVPL